MNSENVLLAVVIPSYKVKNHILQVISDIPPQIGKIYVVDDCCPDGSGDFVQSNCLDPRVTVLRHAVNQGVGGAVMTGYQAALADGVDVVVKIDGDGQMDPSLIFDFIDPIVAGDADYAKGNRFFNLEQIHQMPKMRLFGNAVLSFMTKFSSGYWHLFDPTNGYTAIHHDVLRRLPFDKISRRYFFETDMLFRLNTLRAVAVDVPMDAKYDDEVSGLKISTILFEFLAKQCRNFGKRIFYNYYLRDMSVASVELPLGIILLLFGTIFGGYHWIMSAEVGSFSSSGTVMLSGLPIILGLQLILGFLAFDINSVPTRSIRSAKKKSLARKL